MPDPVTPIIPVEPVPIAPTPFADMTAQQASDSHFWNVLEYGISTDERGNLTVRTMVGPLDLALVMPPEVRAGYLDHGISVHQRVIDSFVLDMLEMLAVMKFKLATRLAEKA